MAARRLLTRGPNPLEPPEAQPQTVPVGKRTALKVQEKVAPRRAGIRVTCRSCSAAAGAKSEGGEPVRYYLGVDWEIRRMRSGWWMSAGRSSPRARCRTRRRA
jgi:hypothetical protein